MLLIVCCAFFPFILDIKFVERTSRCHTGFLIHLPSAVRALVFLARRIQPFLSLVDREVEFCVLTILIVIHLGILILIFSEKIPFTGTRTQVPTCEVKRLLLSYRGGLLIVVELKASFVASVLFVV